MELIFIKSYFKVRYIGEKIEILDLYLNKLVTFEFKSDDIIDISNLKNGIYIIMSSRHGTVKFIKN